MKRGLLTLCAVLTVASVAACGGDDAESSPSATVGTQRATSTTLSVEQEVEAAYLHSWDVYTEAMEAVDATLLPEAFAGRALEIVREDVAKLEVAGHRGRMRVEHDYTISVEGDVAVVIDDYVNHSVLLDGETGDPIEADPNEVLHYQYELKEIEGAWKVIAIKRS